MGIAETDDVYDLINKMRTVQVMNDTSIAETHVIKKIDYERIFLVGYGDLHIENLGTDLDRIEMELKIMSKIPNLYVVFMGDLTDSSVKYLNSNFDTYLTPKAAREFGYRIFDALGSKLICALSGCFLANSRVMTDKGYSVPIECVDEGENVQCQNENAEVVTHWHNQWDGDVVKFKLMGAIEENIATSDHKFFGIKNSELTSNSRKWVVKENLNLAEIEDKIEEHKAIDLNVGDYVYIPNPALKEENVIDTNIAKLAGWYAAEGHLQKESGNPRSVAFTLNITETEYAKEIIELGKIITQKNITEHERKARNTRTVSIFSKEVAMKMKDMCGEYNHHKELSMDLMNANKESFLIFLSRLIQGDGYIGNENDKRIILDMASWRLIEQIRTKMMSFGYYVGMGETKRTDGRRSYQLNFSNYVIKDLMPFFDEDHFKTQNKNGQKLFQHAIKLTNGFLVRIQKKTIEEYRGETHNLEVANAAHSYTLSSGAAVKNCHEKHSEEVADFDYVEDYCKRKHIPFLNERGLLTLELANERILNIAVAHKAQRYSMYNPFHPAIRIIRESYPDADVVITAHQHQSGIAIQNEQGKPRAMMTIGSRKQGDRYATRRGFEPQTPNKNLPVLEILEGGYKILNDIHLLGTPESVMSGQEYKEKWWAATLLKQQQQEEEEYKKLEKLKAMGFKNAVPVKDSAKNELLEEEIRLRRAMAEETDLFLQEMVGRHKIGMNRKIEENAENNRKDEEPEKDAKKHSPTDAEKKSIKGA